MNKIEKKININDLYVLNDFNTYKLQINKTNCATNTHLIENKNILSSLKLNSFILFELYVDNTDLGLYDVIDDTLFYETSETTDNNYVISGESISYIDILKDYRGELNTNINVSDNDSYTAVLNINSEYIEYVIGGQIIDGQYVEKTGIIYKDYVDYTLFKYYPYFNITKKYKYFIKDDLKINLLTDLKTEDSLFIDRGQAIYPNGIYSIMSELNNIDELSNLNIRIV